MSGLADILEGVDCLTTDDSAQLKLIVTFARNGDASRPGSLRTSDTFDGALDVGLLICGHAIANRGSIAHRREALLNGFAVGRVPAPQQTQVNGAGVRAEVPGLPS